MLKYVVIIPDGGADASTGSAPSPLCRAYIPAMDFIARHGVCGLMQTLYHDLPCESMVAHLGMLGWDPRIYYPHGRASSELLASHGVHLQSNDIAFRANFVRMGGNVLESYNAHDIESKEALKLVSLLTSRLCNRFPEIDLYHQSDFRNALIVRGAGIDPRVLICPEPHESEGCEFDLTELIGTRASIGVPVANRLNEYLMACNAVLEGSSANALFLWSASKSLHLTPFRERARKFGNAGVVGFMDFLCGIAKAGALEFHRVGNGRPDTDYCAKGRKVIELLGRDYEVVICHINGPDEASHMHDLPGKILSLEQIDQHIVRPTIRYFQDQRDELGGVIIIPDHYSNTLVSGEISKRSDIHSTEPVPFALWNRRERDRCAVFNEHEAARGKYGESGLTHLHLLNLLFNGPSEELSTNRS